MKKWLKSWFFGFWVQIWTQKSTWKTYFSKVKIFLSRKQNFLMPYSCYWHQNTSISCVFPWKKFFRRTDSKVYPPFNDYICVFKLQYKTGILQRSAKIFIFYTFRPFFWSILRIPIQWIILLIRPSTEILA